MFGNKERIRRLEATVDTLIKQRDEYRDRMYAEIVLRTKAERDERAAAAKIEAEKRTALRAKAEVAAEWLADLAAGNAPLGDSGRLSAAIFLCKSVLGWGKDAPEFKPVEYSQSIRSGQNKIYGALMGNIFGR